MRLFGFILAFWVLALSCMPCNDETCSKPEGAKTEIARSTPCQEKDADYCPPFCNCSCCSFFSINYAGVFSVSVIPEVKTLFTSYLPDNTNKVSIPIWQPPQLV